MFDSIIPEEGESEWLENVYCWRMLMNMDPMGVEYMYAFWDQVREMTPATGIVAYVYRLTGLVCLAPGSVLTSKGASNDGR